MKTIQHYGYEWTAKLVIFLKKKTGKSRKYRNDEISGILISLLLQDKEIELYRTSWKIELYRISWKII